MCKLRILVSLLMTLVIGTIAAYGDVGFWGLGDLSGGTFESRANRVSGDGRVVVGMSRSALGPEAFRWENGVMSGLGDLAGGAFDSDARAASWNGAVVAGRGISGAGNEAFRWEGGSMVGLGFLPPNYYPNSAAAGVSADGSVLVGTARYGPGDAGTKAFRWQNGTMTGYLLPGYTQSAASDVSADGSVFVGHAYIVGVNPEEAYRCEDGVMTGLGDLPGGIWSSAAYGVSPDGGVVVGYGRSAQSYEAFRWEDGTMVGLGHLPGGTFSAGFDACMTGSVIVGVEYLASGTVAMIWDSENGMRGLADVLVNDYQLDLTGWTLREATGVSDDGQTIVGWGVNPQGFTEGWIATVPEPASLALLALGALCLLRFRR